MKVNVRYSEAFKMKVVLEVESGRWESCHSASVNYGIKGKSTVAKWAIKYGKNHLLGKFVRVETMDERNALKEAKNQVKKLEHIVSELKLDLALSESFLQISCRNSGEKDVGEFKKKHASRLPDWLSEATRS